MEAQNRRLAAPASFSPGEEYVHVAKEFPSFEHVDWRHAPLKWKLYRGCPALPLGSADEDFSPVQVESCLWPLSLARLSQFLAATYGLTRQQWISTETVNALLHGSTMAPLDPAEHTFTMELLRPVPSGGGLFPAELYLALAPGSVAPPLVAGLYHYDALHHALDLLNPAPAWLELTRSTARSGMAPITLLLSCSFWKTAFKYGAFSYRLHSLDLGALVAQCLEVAHALGLPTLVQYQFLDHPLNQQLGLDSLAESVYAVINLMGPETPAPRDDQSPDARPALETLTQTWPISEIPLLEALHRNALYHQWSDLRPAGCLAPPRAPAGTPVSTPPARPLNPLTGRIQRHSTRHFVQAGPLSYEHFAHLLQTAREGYENDLDGQTHALQHTLLYCLVSQVENIAPGVYCFVPTTGELIQVRAGDVRAEYQASVPSVAMPNTHQVSLSLFPVGSYTQGFHAYGDRWYRVQNMEAGLLLQRLSLAAAALGLGCLASLTYSGATLDRLLQLPAQHTALVQILLGTEQVDGQLYELPLNGSMGRTRTTHI